MVALWCGGELGEGGGTCGTRGKTSVSGALKRWAVGAALRRSIYSACWRPRGIFAAQNSAAREKICARAKIARLLKRETARAVNQRFFTRALYLQRLLEML
jgi:hypothetical protein